MKSRQKVFNLIHTTCKSDLQWLSKLITFFQHVVTTPGHTIWLIVFTSIPSTYHYYDPKVEETILAMGQHILALDKPRHLLLGGAVWSHKPTVPFTVPILKHHTITLQTNWMSITWVFHISPQKRKESYEKVIETGEQKAIRHGTVTGKLWGNTVRTTLRLWKEMERMQNYNKI